MRWGLMVAAVLLSLTLAAFVVAASTPESASAKKKCKRAKSSAQVAKKKRCKKKPPASAPTGTTPTPVPGETSRQRVSLSWSTANTDLNLFVWDDAGDQAGFTQNAIPSSTNSGDVAPNGPETFTDNLSPFNRAFAVGVCVRSTLSLSAIPYTLTYVDGSGTTHSYSGSITGSGAHTRYTSGNSDSWFGSYDANVSAPLWCQGLT